MLSSHELLTMAGEVEPEQMEKIAAIVYALEKVNPVAAEEVVSGMREVTDYTITKLAQGYGPMSQFGAGLAGGVISGLAGNMVADLYDVAKRGLSKQRNFNQIMKVNPELKGIDKKRLQQSYTALHRYAPEFTADPILGGSLLKAVAEVPGNEHVIIKDLINARKSLQDVKGSQFRMGPTPQLLLPSKADAEEAAERRRQFELGHQREVEKDRTNLLAATTKAKELGLREQQVKADVERRDREQAGRIAEKERKDKLLADQQAARDQETARRHDAQVQAQKDQAEARRRSTASQAHANVAAKAYEQAMRRINNIQDETIRDAEAEKALNLYRSRVGSLYP